MTGYHREHVSLRKSCHKCGYEVQNDASSTIHLILDHVVFHDKNALLCSEWDADTILKTSMKMLNQWKHEQFDFDCHQCDFEGKFVSQLRKHIHKKHVRLRN